MFLFTFLLSFNLHAAYGASYAENGSNCIKALQVPQLGKLTNQIRGSDFRFVSTDNSPYLVAVERSADSGYKLRVRQVSATNEVGAPLTEVDAHLGLTEAPYIIDVHAVKNSLIIVTRDNIEVVDLKSDKFIIRKSGRLSHALYSELETLAPTNFETYKPSTSLRLKSQKLDKDYLLIGTRDAVGLWSDSPNKQNAYLLVLDLKNEAVINYVQLSGVDQITLIERTDVPGKFKITYKIRDASKRLIEEEKFIEISPRIPSAPNAII